MIKRTLAIFLFCLLSLSGIPASQSAPLCAQMAPECCCVESPSASAESSDSSFDISSVSAAESPSTDSSSRELIVASTIGHDDCCCTASEPEESTGSSALTVRTIDLIDADPRAPTVRSFPLYKTFSLGGNSDSTRPLHLATNKVYLLKRSFLI
jgi:hypothetical protein